jgi:hypothetical protein
MSSITPAGYRSSDNHEEEDTNNPTTSPTTAPTTSRRITIRRTRPISSLDSISSLSPHKKFKLLAEAYVYEQELKIEAKVGLVEAMESMIEAKEETIEVTATLNLLRESKSEKEALYDRLPSDTQLMLKDNARLAHENARQAHDYARLAHDYALLTHENAVLANNNALLASDNAILAPDNARLVQDTATIIQQRREVFTELEDCRGVLSMTMYDLEAGEKPMVDIIGMGKMFVLTIGNTIVRFRETFHPAAE